MRPRAGFTLLEVLMALSISAVLMLVVFSVLEGALDAQVAIEDSSRHTKIATAIFEQMSRDFESATCRVGGTTIEFQGGGSTGSGFDRVDMITLVPSTQMSNAGIRGGLSEAGWQVIPIDGSPYGRLVRREAVYVDDAPTSGGQRVPVYDGVFRFDIEYDNGGERVDAWEQAGELPRAVVVTLGLWAGQDQPAQQDRNAERVFKRTFPIRGRGVVIDLDPKRPEGG